MAAGLDRILAAEHEISRLKDEFSAWRGPAQSELERRRQAILAAETAADLEAILRGRHRYRASPTTTGRSTLFSRIPLHRRTLPVALGVTAIGIVALALLRWGPLLDRVLPGTLTGSSGSGAVTVSFETGDRVAIVSFNISGLTPSEVALQLEEDSRIMCRPGLHCSPVAHKTLGTFPQGSVRLSPGHFNSGHDIERTVEAVRQIARKAR